MRCLSPLATLCSVFLTVSRHIAKSLSGRYTTFEEKFDVQYQALERPGKFIRWVFASWSGVVIWVDRKGWKPCGAGIISRWYRSGEGVPQQHIKRGPTNKGATLVSALKTEPDVLRYTPRVLRLTRNMDKPQTVPGMWKRLPWLWSGLPNGNHADTGEYVIAHLD